MSSLLVLLLLSQTPPPHVPPQPTPCPAPVASAPSEHIKVISVATCALVNAGEGWATMGDGTTPRAA